MKAKLFTPMTFKGVTLKNRITMSPMCMYSANEDGKVNDWHMTHYISRAVGQVGLIMVEATTVTRQGQISPRDLGIWSDEQVPGLKKLVEGIKAHGSKTAIQLGHAGRKAVYKGEILAPSALPFDDQGKIPLEMTDKDIENTVHAFKDGTRRAREAGFDIIEVHAAHGYLISQFLSPLANKRKDKYGGARENRFQFLKEVLEAVKTEWEGPIFVRISADEYHSEGNQAEDFIFYAKEMKKLGVDLIDCSTGGIVRTPINVYPGYQISHAEMIKRKAFIPTGAVGMITSGLQAEEILQNDRADLIFLARELLRNPYWARTAAEELGEEINGPEQYKPAW
ncbi:NADPH dehydrogenase NamA [Salipaludibacillus sp. CUR1]|uniref:NADPH dehydrogenase NamA n=1 Tax=Salipaludibacillus sp. CUR1 TaxID=2820003 RepID=UPI001E355500|nr:NADPH dehydrogenase NamA [Salipaludibacillus sp. CUR1]MCE7794375.1 NADPH dehydrogenase NamA [Salipaludibacillus sp. CUR1]